MNKLLKEKAGFTLIELMITTVIIGIVAAMAIPKFQRAYERMQFQASHKEVVSSLKVARSMAITEKVPYGVFFDNKEMSVTLFKDMASGTYSYDTGIDSVIRVDTLPHQVAYVASDMVGDVIFFRSNGSADFSGGGNMFVMAWSPELLGIFATNVLASTGRVHSDSWFY